MSIECGYCERDLRGSHDEDCPRYTPPCPDCDDDIEGCPTCWPAGWRRAPATIRQPISARPAQQSGESAS